MVARRRKILRDDGCIASFLAFLLTSYQVFAGEEGSAFSSSMKALDPPRFELAVESAYLLGFINSPHSYEIGAEFLTARVRWGVKQIDSWLRAYNQFYFPAVAEPIFRGIENRYFGLNFGLRYNFVQSNSRLVPYVSGGVGLGWIDSHPNIPGAQGQDFTFNILAAAGIAYGLSERCEVRAGVLLERLSNAGQSDATPRRNLVG